MSTDLSRRDAVLSGAAAAAGIGLALSIIGEPKRAEADAMADNASLNALLTAEYQAIKAYTAGAGVLQAVAMADPNYATAQVVLAVALHFQSQHTDHANKLASTISGAGGTPIQPSAVTFTLPTGFKSTVPNVIKLAANAEKGAAIAYTQTQKQLSTQAAAQLVAAIGGVETQHFVVLSLLAQGLIGATGTTQAMASDVVPESFVTQIGAGTTGLEAVADFTFA